MYLDDTSHILILFLFRLLLSVMSDEDENILFTKLKTFVPKLQSSAVLMNRLNKENDLSGLIKKEILLPAYFKKLYNLFPISLLYIPQWIHNKLKCPICSLVALKTCHCSRMESFCSNGHAWYYEDGKIIVKSEPFSDFDEDNDEDNDFDTDEDNEDNEDNDEDNDFDTDEDEDNDDESINGSSLDIEESKTNIFEKI